MAEVLTFAAMAQATAKARSLGWSWLASQMTDGRIFADLPDLVVPRVKDTIGRYEPATGQLPLPTAPVDWERVLTPGATCFHLMRENPDGNLLSVPQWSGFITEQPLNEGDTVEFPMATMTAYFDRRYVGNKTYTQVGQNLIVKDLVESYAATGPNGGIPIRVEIVGGDGKLRDREYKDEDDKTLYSVLQELMEVEDGPEWHIYPERLHDPERITHVLVVGDRIGSPVTAGLGPAAVFEMPGAVRAFERSWSYTSGKGANVVMAVSSGQGDVRPQSVPVVTPDPLRPTFEHRFTPSTSIKETATLDGHARRRAALMAKGARSLMLDAVANVAPVLNVDWRLGDDIGFKIGDTFTPTQPVVPAFPHGIHGTARAIGVEFSFDDVPTVGPIIAGGDIMGDNV